MRAKRVTLHYITLLGVPTGFDQEFSQKSRIFTKGKTIRNNSLFTY